MSISPHKLRVCTVLAPRFLLEFCTRVFFMFCVLRLATEHRVCAVLFPRPLLSLHACACHVFVMRTLICLTNIGFVHCLSLGSLLKSLYAYLCHVMLCVLHLKNISFVQCISIGSLLQCYSLQLQPCIGHVFLCVFFSIYMVLRHSPSKRWLCSSCRLFLLIPLDLPVSCI